MRGTTSSTLRSVTTGPGSARRQHTAAAGASALWEWAHSPHSNLDVETLMTNQGVAILAAISNRCCPGLRSSTQHAGGKVGMYDGLLRSPGAPPCVIIRRWRTAPEKSQGAGTKELDVWMPSTGYIEQTGHCFSQVTFDSKGPCRPPMQHAGISSAPSRRSGVPTWQRTLRRGMRGFCRELDATSNL